MEVAYLEYGSSDGKPIILLHGWPDGPLTWSKVAPALADKGWRVLVPAVRGFGKTRFLDESTIRSGQATALAQDCASFADALAMQKFTLVGHDWGGHAAYQFAANWPERLERLVVLSVQYKSSTAIETLSAEQQSAYWYQWLLQTDQARRVYDQNKRAICHRLWETWMAPGNFQESEFAEISPDWNNPDWVDVTLSSYRFRWRNDAGDPRYDKLESVRLATPTIKVPTVLLHGQSDGATLASSSQGEESYFANGYQRIEVKGVGHFIQREKPQDVIDVILS